LAPPYCRPERHSDRVAQRAADSLKQKRPSDTAAPRPDRVPQIRYETLEEPTNEGVAPGPLIVDGGFFGFAPLILVVRFSKVQCWRAEDHDGMVTHIRPFTSTHMGRKLKESETIRWILVWARPNDAPFGTIRYFGRHPQR